MEYTNNSNLETYILSENDDLIGFFELLFHPESQKCEVAYFGILDQFIGKKYGAYLLSEALKLGFRKPENRATYLKGILDEMLRSSNERYDIEDRGQPWPKRW